MRITGVEFYLFYSSAEFHVGADLIVWDAEQLLRCWVQTFFWGGGGVRQEQQQPQNLTGFTISWGQNCITPYKSAKGGW